MSKYDFRPYVPAPDYPRVANLGRDPYEHAERMAANPHVQQLLLEPWAKLYEAPFVGVTTDGQPLRNLYARAPNGAPVEAMAAAATNLLAIVSADQRKALLFPIDARDWRRWNNTEIYFYQYGLRLEELSDVAREGVLAVVRASLSQKGYDKTRNVIELNLFLGELLGNTKVFGEFSYNFSIFGVPSTSEPWGWQLMGHHLALNCIAVDGQLVLSPTFMGAEPNFADTGPFAHVHLFQDEENGGQSPMRSLTRSQQEKAIVNHSILGKDQPPGRWHPADHLHMGGARQDSRIIPYEGVRAAEFSADQRRRSRSDHGLCRPDAGRSAEGPHGRGRTPSRRDAFLLDWGVWRTQPILLPDPEPGGDDRVRSPFGRLSDQREPGEIPRTHAGPHAQRQ